MVIQTVALLKSGVRSFPVELFVKREPTKVSKLRERRPRIIANLPLLVKIATAAFMRSYLDKMASSADATPSKYAYCWLKGGVDRFFRRFDDKSDNWVAIDKKNYDATVSGWSWSLYHKFVPRMCVNRKDFDVQMWTAIIEYHSRPQVFILSNGLVFQQTEDGRMPSGSMCTIDKNSIDQVAIKIWFCFEKRRVYNASLDGIFSVGDDTLERCRDGDCADYVKFQRDKGYLPHEMKTGFLVDLNFVGKNFKRTKYGVVGVPAYYEKNLWSLMCKEKKKLADDIFLQTLDSYCIEYAHHPEFLFFYELYGKYDDPSAPRRRSVDYYLEMHYGE